MKRVLYFVLVFILLFGGFSIYQYVQYQQQLDALKAADSRQAVPIDAAAIAHAPDENYYVHHEQMSNIACYNPLLRPNIQKKLYFYDYTKYTEVLLDFLNLLLYRDRLLAQADSSDYNKIEAQIQEYSDQLCTHWKPFAQHIQQTYPNMPKAAGLNNICATGAIRNYKQIEITDLMVTSTLYPHNQIDIVGGLERILGI